MQELDGVILTTDLPEHNLRIGDVGTIVLVHSNGEGYEVEFVTLDGETVAVISAHPHQIRAVQPDEIAHARPIKAA